MKGLAIVLALLVLASSGYGPLQFQFGNTLARLVNNQGYISISCTGGSGNYNYNFSNLPAGWSQSGNNLVIPNIAGLRGAYAIRARVQDSNGNVINGIINLNINGLAVVI